MKADPNRKQYDGLTGIFTRAEKDGQYATVDIAELDCKSLMQFLSKGGNNPLAESTVALLLGHIPNQEN